MGMMSIYNTIKFRTMVMRRAAKDLEVERKKARFTGFCIPGKNPFKWDKAGWDSIRGRGHTFI
jgi:hypothetical protein